MISSAIPPQRRALIKISGEALMGPSGFGIDPQACSVVAREVKLALDAGHQIALVIGGGNIFRGVAPAAAGMDRAQADYIGMLGTMMNGLALADVFKHAGMDARAMSALPLDAVAERYSRDKAILHLEARRVPIFVAGTGNPFFTTDTAAALRGAEIGAWAVFKASRLDGVYEPSSTPGEPRRKIGRMSFSHAMERGLAPIDAAAFALLREQKLPLCVFNLDMQGSLCRALSGAPEGSWFLP
jgi:uridylate kinase